MSRKNATLRWTHAFRADVLRVLACSVALLGTAAGSAPSAGTTATGRSDEPSSAGLRGRIFASDGQPLAGALVRMRVGGAAAQDQAVLVVPSDETGSFSSGELRGRRFDLRVIAADHATWTTLGIDPSAVLNVRLDRGKTLTARVLAEPAGRGIVGARVTIEDQSGPGLGGAELEARTDEDGRFRFEHVPARSPIVRVSADGRATRRMRGTVRGDGSLALDDIWLPQGGPVTGRVVNADGEPVADAGITLVAADRELDGRHERFPTERTTTDEDGRFELRGVSAGTRYHVYTESDGFAPTVAGPFPLAAGEAIEDVEIVVRAGATLRLRLLDENDVGITSAVVYVESELDLPSDPGVRRVSLSTDDGTLRPDAEGWLVAEHLRPGRFTVRIEPAQHIGLERKGIELEAGQTRDLGPFELESGERMSGRIVGRDGEPVPAARVRALWRDFRRSHVRETTADSSGRFVISGAPDHAVSLSVEADGFVSHTVERFEPGDGAAPLVLDRPARLRGRVRLPDDEPATEFGLRFVTGRRRIVPEDASVRLGDAGSFSIDDLAPGRYTVEVIAPGHAPGHFSRTRVAGGDDVDLGTLVLEQGISLRGRVVQDLDGAPIVGARLRIDPGSGPASWKDDPGQATATSDASGRFVFTGLLPERYTVTVAHPDYAPLRRSVEPAAADAPAVAELRLGAGGSLVVRIRDAEGFPLDGVQLFVTRLGGFDQRVGSTRADGSARFERLEPGSYILNRIRPLASLGSAVREVEVRVGEVSEVELRD